MKQAWKKPDPATLRQRMTEWRAGDAFTVVDKPLRIDRARALGYKDKKGFVVVRARVQRGGHRRPRPNKARRSKRMTIRKTVKMSYKWISEIRAEKRFTNLEVLNSYPIGKDGIYAFHEIIMVDPSKPEIKNDPTMNWILKGQNKNRAARGITAAGKVSRGHKSKHPTNKTRPSVRSGGRLGK